MPEDDVNVLCHRTSGIFGRSNSINLPILKYIQEIEHLHQNLIKVRSPPTSKASRVPVRCRLVIVPKTRGTKQTFHNDIPFDSIVVSRPAMVNSLKPVADDGDQKEPPSSSSKSMVAGGDDQKPRIEADDPVKLAEVGQKSPKKHIYPCTYDLTKAQRERIDSHLRVRAEEQSKFHSRVREIEEEIKLILDEAEQGAADCELQQELWGDHVECVPRRKRVFARRLSMVSLGVKQIINWKKPPIIMVKYNKVFEMRKASTKYCKGTISTSPEEPIKEVLVNEVIDFPVTKASQLRKQYIDRWLDEYNREQYANRKYPNRPEFIINKSKLWTKD